jgi:hypothetical protein
MRTPTFHSDGWLEWLRRHQIATLPELKQALGTTVDVTVFRKLKELSYRTSYSHRGRYYTLDEMAEFDNQGLWSFRSVWFSRYSTLLATVEAFVHRSSQGYFADELQQALHVEVKEPLLQLVEQGRIARQPVAGLDLYSSGDPATGRQQRLRRQAHPEIPGRPASAVSWEELKAASVLFSSLLDEKQRRL